MNTSVAYAQIEGGLDTTFGSGGKVTTLVTYISGANAVALQSDRKIVAAGWGFNGINNEFAVVRYDTDGAIDTTFGLEGIDTTRLRGGSSVANAVAIQPNGKIILAGKSADVNNSTQEFALARYTKSGMLDSTFGDNGIDTFYIGSSDDEGNSIAIQPDGKILVAGFSNLAKNRSYSDFALIRVDSNGVLDTTFGTKGRVLTAIGPKNDRSYAIALQKDNKILVTGSSNDGTYRNFVVVRYDTSGVLDSLTFASAKMGRDTIHFWQNDEFAYSMLVQPNGKIVLGGTTTLPSGNSIFALARVDTDGTIDNTFGNAPTSAGRDTASFFGTFDIIRSIAIDSIGRIIAAGYTYNTNTTDTNFAITRFDSTGAVDTTFVDSTGKVTLDIGTTNDEANAVVVQPDEKILMAGHANNAVKGQFALVRYNIINDTASKDTDTTAIVAPVVIDGSSLFVYPNPAQDEALLKYTIVKDETFTIKIYDLLGREVQSVVTNESEPAGSYTDMLNLQGLPEGCYIINLSNTNSQNLSIRLIKQ